MDNTSKFPDNDKVRARLRQKAAWQTKQRETNFAEDGRLAWEDIEKWRKDKKVRLERNDRDAIARNMWKELEEYKSGNRGELTKLLQKLGLKKEKVTLSPDQSKGSPLSTAATYMRLMRGLVKETGEVPGEDLCLLANRVLLGTIFHPVSSIKLQEAQLILDALQVAVDSVDREFNLLEQCMAIAEIRKSREKSYVDAVRRGDNETAIAEFQFDGDGLPRKVGVSIEKWWPLEPLGLTWNGRSFNEQIEPANAFWSRPYRYHDSWAAGVWSGESILFFPHIYLGPAIEWYRGKPENYEKDDSWVDIGSDPEPDVRFDEALQEYLVYLHDPKTGETHHGGAEYDWNMSQAMSSAARWLVIYPDPDGEGLIPAIFSRGEFTSTGLLPLSARLIAEFGDTKHWEYVGRDGAPTLLQRLQDLTGFVTGDFKVIDAWRETAKRFHWNPISRSDPRGTAKIIYRRHLEKWIAEGPRSIDGSEDKK